MGTGARRVVRVLIIDDDTTIRGILRERFEMEGFVVSEASAAEEGLELAGREQFELVVTDHGLPALSGSELIPRLRATQPRSGIILISGALDTSEVDGLYELGLDAFFPKPIQLDGFLETVYRILREAGHT